MKQLKPIDERPSPGAMAFILPQIAWELKLRCLLQVTTALF